MLANRCSKYSEWGNQFNIKIAEEHVHQCGEIQSQCPLWQAVFRQRVLRSVPKRESNVRVWANALKRRHSKPQTWSLPLQQCGLSPGVQRSLKEASFYLEPLQGMKFVHLIEIPWCPFQVLLITNFQGKNPAYHLIHLLIIIAPWEPLRFRLDRVWFYNLTSWTEAPWEKINQ